MISEKFKTLILLSAIFFGLHGAEEYVTGFYQTDSWSRYVFQLFEPMTSLQAAFLMFQIMIGVILIVSYLLLKGGKVILIPAIFLGGIFIFELHHLVKAIEVQDYYPGIITAIAIYLLGFFYWKEFLLIWRKTYGRS